MSRDPQEPVGPNHSVGRYARVIALETPSLDSAQYVEGARYDEVQLARQCKLVEHNRYACSIKTLDQIVRSNSIEHYSIILIPNLLSAEECEMLVREVESEHEKRIQAAPAGALRGRMSSKNPALHERYPINNLSEAAQRVFDTAFFKRLLPFVSAELPSVAAAIWAQSYKMGLPRDGFASDTPLDSVPFKFPGVEPAINRYEDGGQFYPHRDGGHALTLNILLCSSDGFGGGGTEFWRQNENDTKGCGTARIEPVAGAGIIFNGDVRHCGRSVTWGVRHVLVASSMIAEPGRTAQTDRTEAYHTWLPTGGPIGDDLS